VEAVRCAAPWRRAPGSRGCCIALHCWPARCAALAPGGCWWPGGLAAACGGRMELLHCWCLDGGCPPDRPTARPPACPAVHCPGTLPLPRRPPHTGFPRNSTRPRRSQRPAPAPPSW
jgi:hypothetical protein